ncbi:MAG: guanylate kinase [Eubacterium sp.]|nr:guanylate kinase [Eubacterium sp.]
MTEGLLVVISGFSGSGKSTITKRLLEEYENYALSVSATTRSPREGEAEGVDYFYKTEEEFLEMIDRDAFLEYAYYVDHAYGTPMAYVEEQLAGGKDVLLEIEIQGALKVKARRPETILIFVTPPNAAVLEERLTGRGTETKDVIYSRLHAAVEEAAGMEEYDYILINDDLDACVRELHNLIQTQHCRTAQRKAFIRQIQKELTEREETLL